MMDFLGSFFLERFKSNHISWDFFCNLLLRALRLIICLIGFEPFADKLLFSLPNNSADRPTKSMD